MKSINYMSSVMVERLYRDSVLARVVPTLHTCLARELKGMSSILDLGCGASSPVAGLTDGWKVGVEGDEDSAERARRAGTHNEVMCADLRKLHFPRRSFDAVVLIEVIEHLQHYEGERLLDAAMGWARYKVIVTTPNGYWPQGKLDGNELQEHLCGWSIEELLERGMRVNGMAGARVFRKENCGVSNPEVTPFAATLRWEPWQMTMALAAVSQIITYRVPKYAFELFAVKEVNCTD